MTWLLTIGWVATISILTNDAVNWSMSAKNPDVRPLRLMIVLAPLMVLTMFAIWTVIYPYVPLKALPE